MITRSIAGEGHCDLDEECSFCGKKPWIGFYSLALDFYCCRDCAVHHVPSLIADSVENSANLEAAISRIRHCWRLRRHREDQA